MSNPLFAKEQGSFQAVSEILHVLDSLFMPFIPFKDQMKTLLTPQVRHTYYAKFQIPHAMDSSARVDYFRKFR